MKRARVLYVDDSSPDRELVHLALRQEPHYYTLTACSPQELEGTLNGGDPDIVLIDLGGAVELDVLGRLLRLRPNLPVVVLSGVGSEEHAIEAIKRGAADYLVKGSRQLQRLAGTLEGILERVQRPALAPGEEAAVTLAALDALPANVALLDHHGRILAINRTWRRQGPQAGVGDDFLELCPECWGTEATAGLRSVLEGDRPEFVDQYLQELPDGRRQYFELRVQPVPSGALILHQLVPEEKSQEVERWESESILSQLGDGLGFCFWLSTPNNRLLYISPSYETLTGMPREAAYSPERRLESIVPEDRERVLMARAAMAVAQIDVEYRVRRPDGQVRWLRSRGFPVRNSYGEIVRVAGVLEDVTRLHEAQEILKRHAPPAPPEAKAQTIAVAEDEPAIRSLIARVLRRRGYQVVELAAGADLPVLEAEVQHLDLLITDVFIPGTTGPELAKKLTARFPGLKVLYMSGYTPEALERRGLSPEPLLTKPFQPDRLLELLKELLGEGVPAA